MRLGFRDRYLIFGLRRVEGWLEPYSAEFIFMLSDVQRRAGITGAVAEIGVHHGKLFNVLALGTGVGEKALAIDIFEYQHLNVDRSGLGDRSTFLANVRSWTDCADRVEIVARSSLEVRAEEILALTGQLRLASIDGGHTEECTLNDLRLFERCLAPQGIVIIDDYFNPHWPDVSTGVAKYFARPEARLRPFAISPNKVYLTAPENVALYRAGIADASRVSCGKDQQNVRRGGRRLRLRAAAHRPVARAPRPVEEQRDRALPVSPQGAHEGHRVGVRHPT